MADIDKEVNEILNGRNFSECSEEEKAQILAIYESEEYKAGYASCKSIATANDVMKEDTIKSKDRGCYVVIPLWEGSD